MLQPIYVTSALKPLNAATPSLFFITYLNLDFYLENMFGSFILGKVFSQKFGMLRQDKFVRQNFAVFAQNGEILKMFVLLECI